MTDSIEPGDVTRWNSKVPTDDAGEMTNQAAIQDYLEDEYDNVLNESARREFAKQIAEKRRDPSDTGPDLSGVGDVSFDPDAGAYRGEDGRFRRPPEDDGE